MASSAIPEVVFVDTQVFEGASFNLSTTAFTALKEHLKTGRLRLVIADITAEEVKARIAKNVAEELGPHKKFRKDARVLRSSSLPEAKGVLVELDADTVIADLHNWFEEFLDEAPALVIDTSEQEAGPVLENYFAGKPPFGTGDKKSEFPDAFAIQALIEWAEDNEEDLFVVSGDEPFRAACADCKRLHPLETLSALLDHVASDDEKVAEFLRAEVVKRADEIGQKAKTAFEDRVYYVEDEDGDAEVEVTSVKLKEDPEILEIGGKAATIEMTFEADFLAHLSYDDSTTGVYDSEDKRMMFMEHVDETLEKNDDLVVEVSVAFNGTDPAEFDIEDVKLTEPDESYSFATSRMDGYPWK